MCLFPTTSIKQKLAGRHGSIITGKDTWLYWSFRLVPFRFQQLYDEWKENGTKFTGLDYSIETPSWAVYGSEERGFDPSMKRHYRNSC